MGMLKRALGGLSVAVAAGALAALVFALAAPTVDAATSPHRSASAHRHGRAHRAVNRPRGPRGIVRVRKAGSGRHALAHTASVTTCSSNPCLQYHGGPVLHSNTAYVIYWQPNPLPSGVSAFPPGYQALIDQYLTDVQAADGAFGNVYSVTPQYTDGSGNAQYGFTRGTPIQDGDPLPAKQCTDGALLTCLTDLQIQAEIDHVISTTPNLPRGPGPIYFLVTPQGVGSCFSSSPTDPCYDISGGYCAYHSDMNYLNHGETLYANMPYADVNGCQTGDSPPDHPNNNAADDLINVLSHEHIETITDPEGSALGTTGAWYHDPNSPSDPNAYEEIGDVCALDYGTSLSSTGPGGYYNQSIGSSGKYELQTEWSNTDNSCQQLQPPSVALASSPSVYVNHTVTMSASSDQPVTFHWNFGDGSSAVGGGTQSHSYAAAGTYTVSVTAVNTTTNGSSTATRSLTVLNPQPASTFVLAPTAPATGQTVSFDGSASSDTGGSGITAWNWNFGDGGSASGPTATHSYASPGPETATLTVTDGAGISSSSSQAINVLTPPAVPAVPAPSAPPSKPPAAIALQEITISGAKAVRDLLSHGILVNVRCTGVCRATSRLVLRMPSAARGGRRRTSRHVDVEIGRVSGLAGSDGTLRLRIKLTATGRRRLRGLRHPNVIVFVDAVGSELFKTVRLVG
jgi:PKD repeat protein